MAVAEFGTLFVFLFVALDIFTAHAGTFNLCCKSDGLLGRGDGHCLDGSDPDPCCGKGKCNHLCCNCQSGCRDEFYRHAPIPEPFTKMKNEIDLNQWPMLQAHDSATTYAKDRTCTPHHVVNNYAVTQARGSYKVLLDCGARALDVRPYLASETSITLHHGAITFSVDFNKAISDVIEWANLHRGSFVVLSVSHCGGKNDDLKGKCITKVKEALQGVGMKWIECPSSELSRLKLGAAMTKGLLPGGGSVLAINGNCIFPNYDESVECYGTGYSCIDPAKSTTAWDALWTYMDKYGNTTAAPHQNQGLLWNNQAHWQYTTNSIKAGTLAGSCILRDESVAQVNLRVADRIRAGDFKHFNLLEVDNVCDHGPELFVALREHAMKQVGLSGEQVFDEVVDLSSNSFEIQPDGESVHIKVGVVYNVMSGSTKNRESKLIWMEAADRPATNITVIDSDGNVLRHEVRILNAREQWVDIWFKEPVVGPATYTAFFYYGVSTGICKLKCKDKKRLFFHAEWASPGVLPTKHSIYRVSFASGLGITDDTSASLDTCVEKGEECHQGCKLQSENGTIQVDYVGDQNFWGFSFGENALPGNHHDCEKDLMGTVGSARRAGIVATGVALTLVCLLH